MQRLFIKLRGDHVALPARPGLRQVLMEVALVYNNASRKTRYPKYW